MLASNAVVRGYAYTTNEIPSTWWDRPYVMTTNHIPGGRALPEVSSSLFSEATYNGIGFGLGFAVTMRPAETLIAGSPGEYNWGGAATTSFWIDPAEELITIFITQVLPSSAYPIRRELRSMVYAAITESNL